VKTAPAARPAIIAVTGLAKEARIAAGPGVRAIAGGGNARRLADALERELALGARAVISFGIAGGLVEDVASGTWLVARTIVTPNARWRCDEAWSRALAECLPESTAVDLAGVDAPVMDAASKRGLHRATGAAAVDTESHIAAAIAASYGLPFAAFRVVADTARRTLPPVAAVALNRNARISGRAVLGSLAREPGQWPLVLHTAVDARRALRALVRGRRRLGPGLAYPDLGELLLDVS
jgi:adenosylhomocysteine nucleosidase